MKITIIEPHLNAIAADSFEITGIDVQNLYQHKNDKLQVWKKNQEGFYFVFCQGSGIGYWCHPDNIIINEA